MDYLDILNNKSIDLEKIGAKTKENIAKIELLKEKKEPTDEEIKVISDMDEDISADLISYLGTIEKPKPTPPIEPQAQPRKKNRTIVDWIFQQ